MRHTRKTKQKSKKTRKQRGGSKPTTGQRGGSDARVRRNVIKATQLGDEPASNLYYAIDGDIITSGYSLVIAPRYADPSDDEKKNAKYPYEECLFLFSVDLSAAPPNHYPNAPPHFKHETPAIQNYRLHPNLYEQSGTPAYSGKVCLGILGTWGNNDWQSTMSISDVLQGIMGILEANPGTYEPGCTSYTDKSALGIAYNRHVFYESVDVTCKIYKKVIDALPSEITNNIAFKKEGVPAFLEPFLEPLAKRAYSALSFLINKVDEFIQLNSSKMTLMTVMHHNGRTADFGALKACLQAVRDKIPAPLRKNVFKYGQGEIWRALYELSKPKRNGRNMTYEEFSEEMQARQEKEMNMEKEKKAKEEGKNTCSSNNNNNNNNDYEYVYENENENE